VNYVEAVRSLPVPGPQQTRAFADHLTGAHSWYKRRDRFAFTFFLDPNAGGEKFRSQQDGTSYREHFGHWNYQHSRVEAPTVQAADGSSLEVPAELVRVGTAPVNRLIYGRKRTPAADRELDLEDEMRFGAILGSRPSPGFTNGLASAMGLESQLPRLPAPLAAALRPLITLWREESYRRELSETGRALAEVLEKDYSTIGWKALNGDRVSRETYAAWQRTESRRRERALLRGVMMALDAERERQVAGMVKAMVSFLAALSKT
jgi:hypothetical protein